MSLMKLQKLILLKLNPHGHVPLTFCVANKVYTKHLCCRPKQTVVSRQTLCNWVVSFSSGNTIFTAKSHSETNSGYSDMRFYDHLLKNEWSEPVTSRKNNWQCLLQLRKSELSGKKNKKQKKPEAWKSCISLRELTASWQTLKDFSGDLYPGDCLMLYNEMCPHLQDLQTHWIDIFQVTEAWACKVMYGSKSRSNAR